MDYSITPKVMEEMIVGKLSHFFGVSPDYATNEQYYKAVAYVVRDLMIKGRAEFSNNTRKKGNKRVYYLCMEFLMGRSLKNNLYNLNLTDTVKEALNSLGINLDTLYDCEPDAGLGNGGLGRLAACYLDGLATQGYASKGYSILYEFGIFKQKIVDGWQTELPDFWLPGGEAWLVPKEENAIEVRFEGTVNDYWNDGYHHIEHTGYKSVKAVPYDMFVAGKDGKGVSVLRLWDAKAPGIDMVLFNQGDYLRAVEQEAMAEAISKILYPADNHQEGKSLRLRQQYFLSSASIQDIVQYHLRHDGELATLPDKVAIHINDTHPTLAIPELMRILLDECGYDWDGAWDIITRTFAYTNHTVMSEALECWPEDLFRRLLPRIYQIVKEIDNRFRSLVWNATGSAEKVERMAITSNGIIRMANLCVAACHSVNGVSALHSDILKQSVFKDFYAITPEKFTNVTNGIAHRRWLCQANPNLTSYLTELIGDGFVLEGDELLKLRKYSDDAAVLNKLGEIKLQNKVDFSNYIYQKKGVLIDPNSLFDVQVKRLHEYKRQHLNTIHIISKYLEIKANPNGNYVPHTYIFGAKAASGYIMAKKIINLICSLANLVNNDPDTKDILHVEYLEDYNVTLAEALMPAAEISEQISLAGTEASGTGNMKLMINGAITLGTMDGANVEIFNSVGKDNIFIFGMETNEVHDFQRSGYSPAPFVNNNPELDRILKFLNTGINGVTFTDIASNLSYSDPYMVMADFADYKKTQALAEKTWLDKETWNKMSLMNISGAGIFAADRAVNDYARDIWHMQAPRDFD